LFDPGRVVEDRRDRASVAGVEADVLDVAGRTPALDEAVRNLRPDRFERRVDCDTSGHARGPRDPGR
jgi:hypothetical protein